MKNTQKMERELTDKWLEIHLKYQRGLELEEILAITRKYGNR